MKYVPQEDFSIAEEAVEWLMRLSEDDSTACRSAFYAWLRQSPQHVQTFLEASETTRCLKNLDRQRQIDVDALIAGLDTNVVPLTAAESPPRAVAPVAAVRNRAPLRRRWALTAAAAAIVGFAVMLQFWTGDQLSLQTGIGEQRTLKLTDGSLVTLNARSRIEVGFDDAHRNIRLLEGEASFVVAKDASRPFRVFTEEAVASAIGTEFDVQQRAHGTVVSVREGVVQVSAGTAVSDTDVRLSAGEEASITGSGNISSRRLPASQKLAMWRERRLEFHDATIVEVAAEFNRYSNRPIRIDGPLDADKAISGIFNADDPEALLQFLRRDPSLQVEYRADAILIRQNRH